jgi:hypothetical protein
MHAFRQGRRVGLTFDAMEGRILACVFEAVAAHYRVPPDQLDPAVREVFYSGRGRDGMSTEDTAEWIGQLREFKSAHLALIERWLPSLTAETAASRRLFLTEDEATSLLTILNDHRLTAAALHQIGEAELNLFHVHAVAQLSPARQSALLQINLLAELIHELLEVIAPDAARWSE